MVTSRVARAVAFSVVVCFISFPARAKYSGGTGEPNDPYQIATAEDLMLLGETPEDYDKHFILTADIDLDPNLPGRKVFDKAVIAPDVNETDSGFQGSLFTGCFDGDGFAIRNLSIRNSQASYMGLFGNTGSTGRIFDLRLENFYIDCSGFCISGLVGYNRGSIANCRISGSVSGGTEEWCSRLALLAGINHGRINGCDVTGSVSNGGARRCLLFGLLIGQNRNVVSNCNVRGNVTIEGGPSSVGGLIGMNVSSITDCYSTASVSVNSNGEGSGGYGGLVGRNEGVINRCYATGNVSFGRYSDNAGGLVGTNIGSIINCHAGGDVSGTYSNWRLGGFVGWNWGNVMHCYATGNVAGRGDVGGLIGQNRGDVSHAYATGWAIGGPESYLDVGGLVGDGDPEDVSRCYWDVETSGQPTSEGGDGLGTVLMQDPQTFLKAGWDFMGERTNGTSNLWQMPEGGGYPVLSVFSDEYQRWELVGRGMPDDPYAIATAEDLGAILHYESSADYRFVADVNLAGIIWTTTVIPVFDGTFDGNGFTISNLTIHGQEHLGLFGVLDKHAVVENLGIQDANIVGGSSASRLGILAVENWGVIANCQITGNVSGGQYEEHLGGIARYNAGTIADCDPIDYDGPYSVIIIDPEATQEFLMFEGIDFDQVWIPEEADREGLDFALEAFLESEKSDQENTWLDTEYILDNLPRYDKEHSGFILDNSKYIICQMIYRSGIQGSCYVAEYEPGSKFTRIFDGGCGIVRVILDADSKAVINISCNGMA